ncbi:hypothetical protein N8608_00850 [bacterium]|nr:hypothetical protein [bacterium]
MRTTQASGDRTLLGPFFACPMPLSASFTRASSLSQAAIPDLIAAL